MRWQRLTAWLVMLTCPSVVRAGSTDLGPADRAILSSYARDTWRSFEALALPSGLPSDMLTKTANGWSTVNYTSPSDIAAYLWSTLAAEDLAIIDRDEAARRLGQTLGALSKLERSHGFFYNWYDPRDGSTLKIWPGGGPVRPFLSTVDNGWLAASLIMVRNARPQFQVVADAILEPMNFGFFYDPYDATNPGVHPGLLRGGFFADTQAFATFHYGMLNTEARIASYVGIARGHLPRDHYFRMSRARPPEGDSRVSSGRGEVREYLGVAVDEGFRTYRGLRVVPSWDGSMFEALMVSLFVPEAEWAPQGWGVNHPLYVRASIENATQDGKLAAWGASPSSIPGGGYRVYGVTALSADGRRAETTGDSVMTPHASFLALPFAPREALDNIEVLAVRFKAYGSLGFLDSVDVSNGKLAECELAIDQGMIMASVANTLGDRTIQRAFSDGQVAEVIRPLIAPERFGAGIETREVRSSIHPEVPGWRMPSGSAPKLNWSTVAALVDPDRQSIRSADPANAGPVAGCSGFVGLRSLGRMASSRVRANFRPTRAVGLARLDATLRLDIANRKTWHRNRGIVFWANPFDEAGDRLPSLLRGFELELCHAHLVLVDVSLLRPDRGRLVLRRGASE